MGAAGVLLFTELGTERVVEREWEELSGLLIDWRTISPTGMDINVPERTENGKKQETYVKQ